MFVDVAGFFLRIHFFLFFFRIDGLETEVYR